MKKRNIIILTILSLSSIAISILFKHYDLEESKQKPKTNFSIIGKYICDNDDFKEEPFIEYSDYIPAVTFYNNKICNLLVYYGDGKVDVSCSYDIKENMIQVKLNLSGTFFDAPNEEGYPFLNDFYIFNIVDNNHIVIDKGFYTVDDGDAFVK